jgi:hypothetical protein
MIFFADQFCDRDLYRRFTDTGSHHVEKRLVETTKHGFLQFQQINLATAHSLYYYDQGNLSAAACQHLLALATHCRLFRFSNCKFKKKMSFIT